MHEKILHVAPINSDFQAVPKWTISQDGQDGYLTFAISLIGIKEKDYVVALTFTDPNKRVKTDQVLISANTVKKDNNECESKEYATTVTTEKKFNLIKGYYKVKAELLKGDQILDHNETFFYVDLI